MFFWGDLASFNHHKYSDSSILLNIPIVYCLLLLNRVPLYGHNSLFNHSLVDEHLGCFLSWVILTKTVMNFTYKPLKELTLSFLLCKFHFP